MLSTAIRRPSTDSNHSGTIYFTKGLGLLRAVVQVVDATTNSVAETTTNSLARDNRGGTRFTAMVPEPLRQDFFNRLLDYRQ